MIRQVCSHDVDVIRQVLPRAGHTGHLRLAAQLSFRSHFTRHTRHFGRKGVQLVHHRVDRVLQLQNLALHIDRDLARQIATRDGRCHFGNVTDLRREITGHRVNVIRQTFPGASDTRNLRLTTQLAFGADFARHTRHFGGERVQLVHHQINSFLELKNFSAHVHRDLARQVAVGHGNGDLRDISDLGREIAGHLVDTFGQLLPHAADSADLGLAAQLAFGADLARHPSHFRSENAELFDHSIDDPGTAKEFALQRPPVHLQCHRLGQVAFCDGADGASDFGGRPNQVVDERVDRIHFVRPTPGRAGHRQALFELAFLSDSAADPRGFSAQPLIEVSNLVEGVGDLARDAGPVGRQPHAKIAGFVGEQGGKQLPGHVGRAGAICGPAAPGGR